MGRKCPKKVTTQFLNNIVNGEILQSLFHLFYGFVDIIQNHFRWSMLYNFIVQNQKKQVIILKRSKYV